MFLGLVLLLVALFDFTVNSQGVLKPAQSCDVITDRPSEITSQLPPVGLSVVAGESLVWLRSFELERAVKVKMTSLTNLLQQVSSAGLTDESRDE